MASTAGDLGVGPTGGGPYGLKASTAGDPCVGPRAPGRAVVSTIMNSRRPGGLRRRRPQRLVGFDYTRHGAYFVTICSVLRACIFGEIVGDKMQPNDFGNIVATTWHEIPEHYPHVTLDEFIVMPNHIHGVLFLGGKTAAPTTTDKSHGPARGSLGTVVGSFKSAVTREINRMQGTRGVSIWQRNYHDRIIRDEHELMTIRAYILDNPRKWADDTENPAHAIAPAPPP